MMIPEQKIRRVRHERKLRLLQVSSVRRLTPRMVRIALNGAELAGFVSASYDDHVKLFFPQPGQERPSLPHLGPNGPEYPDDAIRPVARDYTPRRYDAEAGVLEIDFALHEKGPASDWARQAQPGQWLGVGGPRGSMVVADDFDWYLLVGDETALPAIGRRLEELPPQARAIVIVEVADPKEEQRLGSDAQVQITWLHRNGAAPGDPALLERALNDLRLPSGLGYTWVAAEANVAKALRQHLLERQALSKEYVKAAGYWKQGSADVHETFSD